jgi:hypothetical protein
MAIYVSSRVTVKQDEYVEFLMKSCQYNLVEAETRRWEIEYQIGYATDEKCDITTKKVRKIFCLSIKFATSILKSPTPTFGMKINKNPAARYKTMRRV